MDTMRNPLTLTLNMKCTEVICHKSYAYKSWLGMCPWNGSHTRWSTFVYCFFATFFILLTLNSLALLYLHTTRSTWRQILCTIYVKAVWSSEWRTSYKYICSYAAPIWLVQNTTGIYFQCGRVKLCEIRNS